MKTRTPILVAVALVMVLSMLLAACAVPTPQVVEKQVTVKETVVVKEEVKVVETQLVEKQVEVVVTAEPPAPAAATNPFTPADDVVVVAHNQDGFDKLDLRQGYPDGSAYFVQLQILEPLILLDDKLEIRDALAEKWEANADSSAYTFTLKKGVKFQDGDPFNAEAVKKHFDFFLSDPPSPVAATLRDSVDKVEVVDENTIRFVLKRAAPLLAERTRREPGRPDLLPQDHRPAGCRPAAPDRGHRAVQDQGMAGPSAT